MSSNNSDQHVAGMSHQTFREVLSSMFGEPGWQQAFARGTGLSPSTVSRYASGDAPIPLYVALIVQMMRTMQMRRIPLPDAFEPSYDQSACIQAVRETLEALEDDERPRWLVAETAGRAARQAERDSGGDPPAK